MKNQFSSTNDPFWSTRTCENSYKRSRLPFVKEIDKRRNLSHLRNRNRKYGKMFSDLIHSKNENVHSKRRFNSICVEKTGNINESASKINNNASNIVARNLFGKNPWKKNSKFRNLKCFYFKKPNLPKVKGVKHKLVGKERSKTLCITSSLRKNQIMSNLSKVPKQLAKSGFQNYQVSNPRFKNKSKSLAFKYVNQNSFLRERNRFLEVREKPKFEKSKSLSPPKSNNTKQQFSNQNNSKCLNKNLSIYEKEKQQIKAALASIFKNHEATNPKSIKTEQSEPSLKNEALAFKQINNIERLRCIIEKVSGKVPVEDLMHLTGKYIIPEDLKFHRKGTFKRIFRTADFSVYPAKIYDLKQMSSSSNYNRLKV